MHRQRLEQLAVMLDEYHEAPNRPRFDLKTWGEFEERRGGFLWLQKHPCDTAACAVGLACISRAFQAEGLSFERTKEIGLQPLFAGRGGWEAVHLFFDLTPKQADRLFRTGAYRISIGETAAKAVAKRIRAMVVPRKRKAKKSPTDGIAVLDQIRR